jgi:hypothetical protein
MKTVVLFSKILVMLMAAWFSRGTALGQSSYPRAGWETHLSEAGHGVSGTVTIVDERTLRLTHFNYDGHAPDMFVCVGTNKTRNAFRTGVGLLVGPRLARAYQDETLEVQLPEGQTLDGWNAVCIWCVSVQFNFGWGTFAPPNRPNLSVTRQTSEVEIKLTVAGENGQRYWLQTATDMIGPTGWQNLVLLTNANGTVRYTNSMAPDASRLFFRAVRD